MNKSALAKKISKEVGISNKKAEEVIDSITNTIIQELVNNNKVSLSGFGAFSSMVRHARNGVNPQNPSERITIPETRVAKFKTGKKLKDALKAKN